MSGKSEVTSVNNFPVCGLFTFFLSVPTETVIRSFGVKTQDLPLFMDPEREGGHRCSYEESENKRIGIGKQKDAHLGKLHEYVTLSESRSCSHPD